MSKVTDDLRKELFELKDEKYRDFQSGLIPNVEKDYFIGVRTPELRKLAKKYAKREDVGDFLNELPHRYFDENQIHAFIISEIKSYDECLFRLTVFLPHVNNWATCDQMSPKIFKKEKDKLLVSIKEWISSKETYTVRFAIKMLMEHFLGEDFEKEYAEMVARVVSEEYYVKMMIAWYFATALAKNYEEVLPFIENMKLEKWTHNKAIQKSVESYRILPVQKEYLKSLKV
ncbi:MAG: DNA alkylation repair protein [Butyrivibrio sp.]|nr:DNA alkylation repair protein [Butyrivibrio sp.]